MVCETTLGNPKGAALFSMMIAFVAIIIVVSLLDRSPRAAIDRAGFLSQQVRLETGIGAAVARR